MGEPIRCHSFAGRFSRKTDAERIQWGPQNKIPENKIPENKVLENKVPAVPGFGNPLLSRHRTRQRTPSVVCSGEILEPAESLKKL
jgi:hypothetical protein